MAAHLSPDALKIIESATGQTGANALAGLDIDFAKRLADRLPPGTVKATLGDPERARRVFLSAYNDVPFTGGQLTGDRSLLTLEDQLRQVQTTPVAAARMNRFQTAAEEAVEARKLALNQGVQPDEARAGSGLNTAIQARRDALKADADAKWGKP